MVMGERDALQWNTVIKMASIKCHIFRSWHLGMLLFPLFKLQFISLKRILFLPSSQLEMISLCFYQRAQFIVIFHETIKFMQFWYSHWCQWRNIIKRFMGLRISIITTIKSLLACLGGREKYIILKKSVEWLVLNIILLLLLHQCKFEKQSQV